jgi:hypothetical protein
MFSVALVGLLGDAPERQALLRMGSRRRLVTRLPGRLRSSAHGSLCWHLSLLALWCHDRHSGRAGLIHVSENSAHWGSMRPEMGRETPVLLRRQPVRLREKTQARAVSARTDEIRREGNGPGSQRGGQGFESPQLHQRVLLRTLALRTTVGVLFRWFRPCCLLAACRSGWHLFARHGCLTNVCRPPR